MKLLSEAIAELAKVSVQDVYSTLLNLMEYWPVKLIWTIIVWLAAHALQLKLHIIFGFAILEFLDCLTRWLAISRALIMAHNPDAAPKLYDCLRGIPAAHRAGEINSGIMRQAFYSKMLTYIILISGASFGDWIILISGHAPMLLTVVAAYLAVTELLSILENLDEAGVNAAHNLLAVAKEKLDGVIGLKDKK